MMAGCQATLVSILNLTTKARRSRRNTKKDEEGQVEFDVVLFAVAVGLWQLTAITNPTQDDPDNFPISPLSHFFVPLRDLRAFVVRFTDVDSELLE